MKAPFPWFGGKSRVAPIVWDRFGDVRNYVEPFAGSLAVLLGRQTEPKIETVNDLDCWIANFWRALQADPEELAVHADWPVNEADLHARHLWLVKQVEFRERMKTDPDYFDVKIAGWWVWGISQWIGSGWCQTVERRRIDGKGRTFTERTLPCENRNTRMHLTSEQGVQAPTIRGRTNAGRAPRGILTEGVTQKRPYLTNHDGGMGVHGGRKRPRPGNDHGRGVLCADVSNQIPDLSGDSGAAGRSIHASGLEDKGGLYQWLYSLADRLRRVRVCCGDWTRILGPAPTTCIGLTGVFLDPPYAVEERSDVYGEESRDLAHDVREWAVANGSNPELRIALCGYEGEHQMPDDWSVVAWKANGGFANQKKSGTVGRENAHRERIWFSPACLSQENLFTGH